MDARTILSAHRLICYSPCILVFTMDYVPPGRRLHYQGLVVFYCERLTAVDFITSMANLREIDPQLIDQD